jgi:hypothetical protein
MRYSGEQQRELDRRTGAELDRRAAGVTNRERYTPEHFAELREQWLQRRDEARKAKATITLAELYGILVEVTDEIDKEKRP